MTSSPLRPLLPALLALTSLTLAACGGSDDGIGSTIGVSSKFRAINGISDSSTSTQNSANPGADVSVTGQTDPRLQDLPFPSASTIRTYPVGSYNVTYTLRNSANASVVATASNTPIDANKLTTTYSGGTVAGGTQTAFAVQTPLTASSSTNADLLLVHDAASAAAVSIYVTTPGAALASSTPVNLSFKGSGTAPSVPGGAKYEIRVTQQGQPSNVLFDSGPTGITLSAGSQYQVSAIDNPSMQGSSPIYVFIVSDASDDPGSELVNGTN